MNTITSTSESEQLRRRCSNEQSEARCKRTYPRNHRPQPIAEQVSLLRTSLGVGVADMSLAKGPLPEGAEAWVAVPRWESLAETYEAAVTVVWSAIRRQRRVFSKAGIFGETNVRQNERSVVMLRRLGEKQRGDILVLPAQFGLRYRGLTPWLARDAFVDGEFGLGLFAAASLLLTHPGRLVSKFDLGMACVGDETDFGGIVRDAPEISLPEPSSGLEVMSSASAAGALTGFFVL